MHDPARNIFEFGYTVKAEEYLPGYTFPLRISRGRSDETSHPVHKHEFTELVIMNSGKALHRTEQGLIPIEKGDVFIIHQGHTHGYKNIHRGEFINIIFNVKRLPLPLADFGSSAFASVIFDSDHPGTTLMKLPDDVLKKVDDYSREIEAEYEKKSSSSDFRCIALFMLVLTELERNFYGKAANNSTPETSMKVLEFMENHYSGEIDYQKLAKSLGMSRRTLFRNFTKYTNSSPHKYLTSIRVRHAVKMLKNSNISPLEVSILCGFKSLSSMMYHLRAGGGNIRSIRKKI